jgi:nickel-dependent lactate racemase
MRFDLQYGAGFLPLEVPDRSSFDIMQPLTLEKNVDVNHVFVKATENPIGSDSLSHLVSQANSIAVVVNGDLDPEPTPLLLNKLLDFLNASISSPSELLVIYSKNSHHSDSVGEIEKRLDINELNGHQLILHDPLSIDNLSFLGDTPTYCTPLHINSEFASSEIKIGLGSIRSNIFVGATGGRMSVLPYCSGTKSIARNAKLQATYPSGPFITDSAACTDLVEASQLACLDFIINAIPDWQNNLHDIVAGNPYSAWDQGVRRLYSMTETTYKRKADIAIVSAGGSPYDKTLFDAVDALYAGKVSTEHNGVLVLVAECAEGVGSEGFMRGVSECGSSDEVTIFAETSFEMGMEKSRFFWDILDSRKVIICSRLRESLVTERFHCTAVKDPQEGYELARHLIVSSPKIAIIPHGIRTLPVMRTG